MSWNDGYVTDTPYPNGVFTAMAPSQLNFSCVLNGYKPVSLASPFKYFELGFGLGQTLTVLAAAHPHAEFFGADFMPAHVSGARELAHSAGLSNLTLLEKSFEQLANGEVALPEFDFITLHGVYTWVSRANQQHIVQFLARYLKPGGVVYVGYNTLPGWATAFPIQRLVRELAAVHPGNSLQKMTDFKSLMAALVDVKADFVTGHPDVGRLARGFNDNAAYLAHEYLNEHWQPIYHADLVRDLSEAKLDYVGSAALSQSFWQATLSPEQVALINSIGNPVVREATRDLICNTKFRKDVFVRGARPLSARDRTAWLSEAQAALVAPRVTITPEAYDNPPKALAPAQWPAVLDALETGPTRLSTLSQLPSVQGGVDGDALRFCITLQEYGDLTLLDPTLPAADPEPARRLNTEITRLAHLHNHFTSLCSPVTGNGFHCGRLVRLVTARLLQDPATSDAARLSAELRPVLDACTDIDPTELASLEGDALPALVAQILRHRLPLLKQLGVCAD